MTKTLARSIVVALAAQTGCATTVPTLPAAPLRSDEPTVGVAFVPPADTLVNVTMRRVGTPGVTSCTAPCTLRASPGPYAVHATWVNGSGSVVATTEVPTHDVALRPVPANPGPRLGMALIGLGSITMGAGLILAIIGVGEASGPLSFCIYDVSAPNSPSETCSRR